jgi:hypothetical protein
MGFIQIFNPTVGRHFTSGVRFAISDQRFSTKSVPSSSELGANNNSLYLYICLQCARASEAPFSVDTLSDCGRGFHGVTGPAKSLVGFCPILDLPFLLSALLNSSSLSHF